MATPDVHPPEHVGSSEGETPFLRNEALRAVIQLTLRSDVRRLQNGCSLAQSGLRENLRTVCAYARRRGIRAEHLLVMIKEVWATLPETHAVAQGQAGSALLSQVVTLTLDEYYQAPMPSD